MGFIYKILCPKTGKPVYIGMTQDLPIVRLCKHISTCKSHLKRRPNPWFKWIYQTIYIDGLMPSVKLIEEVNSKDNISERERYWIKKYKSKYPGLLNTASGGKGVSLLGQVHPNAKLKDGDIPEIKLLYASGKFTQQEIADAYGVQRPCIQKVLSGRRHNPKYSQQRRKQN